MVATFKSIMEEVCGNFRLMTLGYPVAVMRGDPLIFVNLHYEGGDIFDSEYFIDMQDIELEHGIYVLKLSQGYISFNHDDLSVIFVNNIEDVVKFQIIPVADLNESKLLTHTYNVVRDSVFLSPEGDKIFLFTDPFQYGTSFKIENNKLMYRSNHRWRYVYWDDGLVLSDNDPGFGLEIQPSNTLYLGYYLKINGCYLSVLQNNFVISRRIENSEFQLITTEALGEVY